MAQTLMRATRLAQVISVLGNEKDLETTVERAAIEVGELFFADMALLILDSEEGLSIAGHWGVAASDLPSEPFALPTSTSSRARSRCASARSTSAVPWLASYSPRHVAWARLLVGEKSLGLMLLVRRGDEPFEQSEANELRAVAYRIALAIENGLLHKRMTDQLAQLHRLQELTACLPARSSSTPSASASPRRSSRRPPSRQRRAARPRRRARRAVERRVGARSRHRRRRRRCAGLDERWESFPLEVAGKTLGIVAVTGAPGRAPSSTSCSCIS